MKIHTNDKVKILTGKDKSKTGKVIQVFKKEGKVVVEGVNLLKKNIKPRGEGQKGQIIEMSTPVQVSNVKLICPKCNKETRVNYKILEAKDEKKKKNKVRICNKCKEVIDNN
jgi:large subunit ribosomal protein L24